MSRKSRRKVTKAPHRVDLQVKLPTPSHALFTHARDVHVATLAQIAEASVARQAAVDAYAVSRDWVVGSTVLSTVHPPFNGLHFGPSKFTGTLTDIRWLDGASPSVTLHGPDAGGSKSQHFRLHEIEGCEDLVC